LTDGELFWIISNGKGKMPGEGDRTKERVRWNFVNLVRSFVKKEAGDKPKAEDAAELVAINFRRSVFRISNGSRNGHGLDCGSPRIIPNRSFLMAHAPQFLKLVNEAKKKIKETNVADVKRRTDAGEKFLLVDTREDSEWANGHLPGAVHLGRGIIERDIEARVPDTSAKLILYCGGGFRSALVAENLQKMGYNNVESMDGGWKGWLEAGLPTAKG